MNDIFCPICRFFDPSNHVCEGSAYLGWNWCHSFIRSSIHSFFIDLAKKPKNEWNESARHRDGGNTFCPTLNVPINGQWISLPRPTYQDFIDPKINAKLRTSNVIFHSIVLKWMQHCFLKSSNNIKIEIFYYIPILWL